MVTVGCFAGLARAHTVQFPRLVHIVFEPHRLTTGVGFSQHAGTVAGDMRSRFDTDSNGLLDEAEQEALTVWLDSRARRNLRLELNSTPLLPAVVERQLDLARDSGATEGDGIRMSSSAVLAIGLVPGTHELRISDRPRNARQVVPLRIDLPAGWEVAEVVAEGEAIPLTPIAERSWQGAFAGEGGTIRFALTVSKHTEGAGRASPEVGSPESKGSP